jgi:hypothetical protein
MDKKATVHVLYKNSVTFIHHGFGSGWGSLCSKYLTISTANAGQAAMVWLCAMDISQNL